MKKICFELVLDKVAPYLTNEQIGQLIRGVWFYIHEDGEWPDFEDDTALTALFSLMIDNYEEYGFIEL